MTVCSVGEEIFYADEAIYRRFFSIFLSFLHINIRQKQDTEVYIRPDTGYPGIV